MDETTDHYVKQSKSESKRQTLGWTEAQLFRACVALTEDLSLISSTHTG